MRLRVEILHASRKRVHVMVERLTTAKVVTSGRKLRPLRNKKTKEITKRTGAETDVLEGVEMAKTKIAALIVATCVLSGCSYNLALMARGSSKTGTGTATRPGNDVTIEADGITYTGKYAYMEGGFVGVGSSFSGTRTATGTMVGSSAQGNGNIIARSADGKGMRCEFSFSGWSQSGIGVCQDDFGTIYDLQIGH